MPKPKRSFEEVSRRAFPNKDPLDSPVMLVLTFAWLIAVAIVVGVLALVGWGVYRLVTLAWDVYQTALGIIMS